MAIESHVEAGLWGRSFESLAPMIAKELERRYVPEEKGRGGEPLLLDSNSVGRDSFAMYQRNLEGRYVDAH